MTNKFEVNFKIIKTISFSGTDCHIIVDTNSGQFFYQFTKPSHEAKQYHGPFNNAEKAELMAENYYDDCWVPF